MEFDEANPEYQRALRQAKFDAYKEAVTNLKSAEQRADFARSILPFFPALPDATQKLCIAAIDTILTPPTTQN